MSEFVQRFAERRSFTQERLASLAERLTNLEELRKFPELCVYTTGSYARHEASTHSDIDLFFVNRGSQKDFPVSRLDELRLFARVIDIGENLGFPAFSNDGEYLQILHLDDILSMLGGRDDDYRNFFTARMLLLLESAPLYHREQYDEMISSVVGAYFRDYPDHAINFRPVFLINDVLRFWKTLCLNYEHRRNKPDSEKEQKRKQQVKNFKLKFSRLMTCFGTVVATCAKAAPITQEDIITLVEKVPLDRFLAAVEPVQALHELSEAIISDYEWFMGKTALPTEELRDLFESKEARTELFSRADTFSQRVYDVLTFFAEQHKYSRYLVV